MRNKGISLIVLVVTIVVSLILIAAVVLNFKDENLTDKSIELSFKSNLQVYKDELAIYITDKKMDMSLTDRFDETELNASSKSELQSIIPSMKKLNDTEIYKYKIVKGKLIFNGTEEQNKWASELETN